MEEISNNEAVKRLLDFAKNKPFITFDDVADILGQDYVNSPDMENVLKILEQEGIQIIETDLLPDKDEEPDPDEVNIYDIW